MVETALDPGKIHDTIEVLGRRIEERFPASGLSRVCGQLERLSLHARATIDELQRPVHTLRALIGILLLVILVGLGMTLYQLALPREGVTLADFVQILEAGINDVVLIGLGAFFLVSIEGRMKRRKALAALHELRSVAHIVDMHQLTKDPGHELPDTESSPQRTMSPAQLARYLDYCSEMLSLTGKIAALYAQRFDDEVVLASVNEVETLTTGLSRKVWQKLMILELGDAYQTEAAS
ncbi:MAG: hypothetical protein AAF682_30700 [Planctomycetota bacterium]